LLRLGRTAELVDGVEVEARLAEMRDRLLTRYGALT